MAKKGIIRLEDFHIIHRVEDNFPYLHSTRLYTEWPMVALHHVPESEQQKMQEVLVALHQDHPAAQKAGIGGWRPPSDYLDVAEAVHLLSPLDMQVGPHVH